VTLVLLAAALLADAPSTSSPGLPPVPAVEPTRVQRNAEGVLLLRLGERILAEGAYAVAAQVLRRGAQVLPDSPFILVALATALLREGRDLEGARRALERALALAPESAVAHARLGLYRALKGDPAGALESHARAAKLRPGDADYQETLGLAALDAGREDVARDAFEEVLRRRPASALALTNLASLYEKEGRLPQAEEALRRLVRLHPGRWPLWDRLARLYDRMKRPADAERARAEVRRLNPPPAPARVDLRELRPVRGAKRKTP
jgi:tetratricopeptide (TPR) repeat protein